MVLNCALILNSSIFLFFSSDWNSFSTSCLRRLNVWKSSSSGPGQFPEPMTVRVLMLSNVVVRSGPEEGRNRTDLSSEDRSPSPNGFFGRRAYNSRHSDICLFLGFVDTRTPGDPCHYKRSRKRKGEGLTRRLSSYTWRENVGLIHTL